MSSLKVQMRSRYVLRSRKAFRVAKSSNWLVVFGAAQPLLAHADVERILEQLLVVGAHVERHGQGVARVHAGARGVQRELTDGDAHALRAQVAQPENALAVGHDDDPNVFLRPVAQHLRDPTLVLGRDVQAARLSEDVPELGARLTHGGRVDDGHHLVDVVDDRAVEQRLVAVLQGDHEDVLLERVRLVLVVLQDPGLLFLDGVDVRRQQPADFEGITFRFREGRPLVEPRIEEECGSGGDAGLRRLAERPLALGGLGRLPRLARGLLDCPLGLFDPLLRGLLGSPLGLLDPLPRGFLQRLRGLVHSAPGLLARSFQFAGGHGFSPFV
jgi:hypothetical protein